MILTHKLTIALDSRDGVQTIDAVQGDTARAVEISLLENGAAWALPEDATAVVRYRRVFDGTGGVYDSLSDGTAAFSISENKVTVLLAPQVLAASGPVELQVTLLQDGKELTCFSVLVHVQGNLGEAAEDNCSYVNLIRHIQAAVEEMNLAKKEQGIIYIVGDSNSSFGVWKGTSQDISTLFDGLTIAYKTPASGGSPATTLDINGLGAVPVKRNATENVNYYYQANTILLLTYTTTKGVASWQMVDMDYNTDTTNTTGTSNKENVKMYLTAASARTEMGTKTYTNVHCYIGADNCLYSGGEKVLTASSIPDEVPDYVRTEAERLAALVQSRQNGNTMTMMLGSDLHARLGLEGDISSDQMIASARHAAQAMEILRSRVHLDFAGLLGDYIWDEGETADQAQEMYRLIYGYFRPAFSGLPQFWCKGNHDMLGNSESGEELTDGQIFSAVGVHNSGAIFGAERVQGYCHRDFEDYQIRVVCMNTSETRSSHAVGTAQNNWLKQVLNVEAGWRVILLSHMPVDWWGTDATVYQTVEGFADKILCNIHGHTHNYVTGTVGNTAIARLAIPNIDFYRANTYADNATFGEAETYAKTADSEADTAFCVITIDFGQNKLYADHYGGDAGYDREIDLSDGADDGDSGESGNYTNQIPLATSTFGGTEIYNTVGYKSGCRINSTFEEVEVNGMCCTGFISVQPGDVVRIKNVTLTGSTTPYLVTYTTTGGEYATLGMDALGAADADGVYTYAVPADTGAIRLSVGTVDSTSIVTVNEQIV